jgi:hypothetical protein
MKSIFTSIVLVAGLIAALSGCTKDSSTTAPISGTTTTSAIAGTWTVISGPGNLKHLEFRDDNLFYLLNQYGYGLRDFAAGVYQVSGGTLDLGNNQYPSLYAVTIKNDTLTLVSPPSSPIVAYKNSSAPSDQAWVKDAVVLDSIPAPIHDNTDITANGNALWYGNARSANHLYKIDLLSRSVDSSLAATLSAWAVEWDGKNLWCSDDGSDMIYKLDSTGAKIATSASMGAWIYGIAWDGTVFWCSSNNENAVYRYNPVSNTVLTTLMIGARPSGLAYAGGYVYLCVNGVINKCGTTPFNTVASYRIRDTQAFGIAFDGTNFWVSCRVGNADNYAANSYRIYKVSLP